jgi:multiple sugar transport system permease protein
MKSLQRLLGTDKEARVGLYLASAYLLFNVVFWVYPFAWVAILSFSDWRFFGAPSFTGLKTFFSVLETPEFWLSMWNVVRFMGFYLPIVLVCSLAFAFGLKHVGRGKAFIALCFLLANISSGVAYSLVFLKIFSETGPVNNFLFEWFGFRVPWLSDPTMAMLSISLVVTWKYVGYYGLILYSGLLAIPDEINDAATLDQASPVTKLFKVTLPMINAQLVMVIVFAVIVAFGIFTEPYMITEGGPLQSTTMPQLVIFETAFRRLQPSHAALMGIIIAVCSYCVIKLIRKLIEKDVTVI